MKIVAYVDGSYKSFDDLGPFYAGAAILIWEDKVQALTTVGNDTQFISMRNVAGEILATKLGCEYILTNLNITQNDELIIRYDYAGIENWCKKKGEPGYWRAKTPLSMHYRDYMNQKVKTRCKVTFEYTPGHTGEFGNEKADEFARGAITDHVQKLRGIKDEQLLQ